MFSMFENILMLLLLGATTSARHNIVPKFYAQDSEIIVNTDQPSLTKSQLSILKPQAATLPYYQPIQTIPPYKIFSKYKVQNSTLSLKNAGQHMPTQTQAAIFTQEEFPRDLLEIAQQKLGLKTLDEVPSVTELAELLGTNSAAETISYIKQLTSTEQGVALMKAYIESSDYTDSVGSKDNEISSDNEEEASTSTTTLPPQLNEFVSSATENTTKPGFFERIAAFLNIYNVPPQHKHILERELLRKRSQPTLPSTLHRNLRPLYVRNPLPYHYPIPMRPLPIKPTSYNAMRMYTHLPGVVPTKFPKPPVSPHINTLKTLTPAHIQQLARIANIPPKTLESFLQRKPKLAELAAKVASFSLTQEIGSVIGSDAQLLAAVHKAIENDEDLRKLLNSTDTLK